MQDLTPALNRGLLGFAQRFGADVALGQKSSIDGLCEQGAALAASANTGIHRPM
jgi:hypothetical protein